MKKNVIYIVVDAFCYNNLELKIGNKEVTPFLNKLVLSSRSFTNIYSQAPYTEASQMSLLGRELPLDCGGYLLGNKNCKETLLENYKNNGYETLFTYSPYIYSVSHLRGVDEYYYTRLFSIEPLFLYRLNYYKDKWNTSTINKDEVKLCISLLEEALSTWADQCNSLLENKDESILIKDLLEKKESLFKVNLELINQTKLFNLNRESYIKEVFQEFDNHILRKLSSEYNNKKELPLRNKLLKKYIKKFEMYQKKYSQNIKKRNIDTCYFWNKLTQNKEGIRAGFKDFFRLLKKTLEHYLNSDLKNYLFQNQESNPEISMKLIFDKFLNRILEKDEKNKKYFAFIQVQDFHLPSMFHTYDSKNMNLIDKEFEVAFELLEELDGKFNGNILAALSARYCDLKLEVFFRNLENKLKNEYIFVVTSDHGYPSYFNPPRSEIYNQTYKEAFHIPLILYDSSSRKKSKNQELHTTLNGLGILEEMAGIGMKQNYENDYILCEYGGPGCPAIYEKNIWYVLITKKIIISLEASLDQNINKNTIKSIFNIEKDPLQKYNLIKTYKDLDFFLKIVKKRHDELKKKYSKEDFFKKYL